MSKEIPKYDYEYFEKFYNETFQNRETFCSDMRDKIAQELVKMSEQFNNWLKEKEENDTGTISESVDNT